MLEEYLDILTKLKKEADSICGMWNGDEAGPEEERAGIAEDISNNCTDIINLINELND